MNVVFVHDHKFRMIDDKIYSPGGLSNEVLSRYVNWFGKVTVVGRVIKEESVGATYSLIKNENVTVTDNSKLKELIKNSDSVIARLPSINGYKAIYYAKKYKKPYITELVGCVLDAYWNYGLIGKLAAIPSYFLVKYLVYNSPNVLYVTNKFLQSRYPTKGYQASISDVALQETDIGVLNRKIKMLAEKKDKIVIGTAAAVDVAYKGQEFVIRAIPEIEKKLGVRLEYQLAGSGNKERLENIAKSCGCQDRVLFLGSLPHDEMFNWLDELDIYIQPSMLEGLSRALVEAMSRGLPCVASNCGGNPELVDAECLFDTGNKNKLASAVCEAVVITAKEPQKWAERNFNLANTQYNSKLLNEKRDCFYKNFANK